MGPLIYTIILSSTSKSFDFFLPNLYPLYLLLLLQLELTILNIYGFVLFLILVELNTRLPGSLQFSKQVHWRHPSHSVKCHDGLSNISQKSIQLLGTKTIHIVTTLKGHMHIKRYPETSVWQTDLENHLTSLELQKLEMLGT